MSASGENKQLSQALNSLTPEDLTLIECCRYSGNIDKNSVETVLLSTTEMDDKIQLKVGVFFREVLVGCVCSDDSSQAVSYENGYCERQLSFVKHTNKLKIES